MAINFSMSHRKNILQLTKEFFESPLWNDTIKDFVLANCYIFIGEEEFSLEHLQCHKRFCEIIENTLNIYLLDIIGVSFDDFADACIQGAKKPNSIARKVLSVLKQATDFKYFAAKMYAYNVMLDREAAATFLLEGDTDDAFFVTTDSHTEQEAALATEHLHQVEKELGLPPTQINLEITPPPPPPPVEPPKPEIKKVEEEKPVPTPIQEQPEETQKPLPPPKKKVLLDPLAAKPEEEAPPPVNARSILQSMPKMSEQEKNAMRRKIQQEKQNMAKTIDPEELQRRKEAFQKRKEELIATKRAKCQDDIELNLKKHEKPVPVQEEDPLEAIRRALTGRVKQLNETV